MYFTEHDATLAITMFLPLLNNAIKKKGEENGFLPNGNGFHIIVGDKLGNVVKRFDLNHRNEWAGPYDGIALDKFELTVEHIMPTREIQLLHPELAEYKRQHSKHKEDLKGHTYYWGSWIDGGIVVACSGIDPEWDEAFSKMIAAAIKAMITKKVKIEAVDGLHFRAVA